MQNAQMNAGVFVQCVEDKKIKKIFKKTVDNAFQCVKMVLYSNGYSVGS